MTDTRDSFDKLISDLRLASGAAQSMKRSGTAMLYDSFADRLTALQSGAVLLAGLFLLSNPILQ